MTDFTLGQHNLLATTTPAPQAAAPRTRNHPWPFLVGAVLRPCADVQGNADRMIATTEQDYSAPPVSQP